MLAALASRHRICTRCTRHTTVERSLTSYRTLNQLVLCPPVFFFLSKAQACNFLWPIWTSQTATQSTPKLTPFSRIGNADSQLPKCAADSARGPASPCSPSSRRRPRQPSQPRRARPAWAVAWPGTWCSAAAAPSSTSPTTNITRSARCPRPWRSRRPPPSPPRRRRLALASPAC